MGNVYGITDVVGTSAESLEDAIQTALRRASSTVRHLDWFEVTDIRGHLQEGELRHYQVTLKLGFRMDG